MSALRRELRKALSLRAGKPTPPLPPRRFRIKLHDKVMVIQGQDQGKVGVVQAIDRLRARVIVEGVNMRWRSVRQSLMTRGGRAQRPVWIPYATIQLVHPVTGQPTSSSYYKFENQRLRVADKAPHVVIPKVRPTRQPLTDDQKAEREAASAAVDTQPDAATKKTYVVPVYERHADGKVVLRRTPEQQFQYDQARAVLEANFETERLRRLQLEQRNTRQKQEKRLRATVALLDLKRLAKLQIKVPPMPLPTVVTLPSVSPASSSSASKMGQSSTTRSASPSNQQ